MPRKPIAESSGEPTLESRLGRLEAILDAMDRDDLELDEALRLFEEGVTHMRAAREALRHAELRIEKLLEDARGDVGLVSGE